MTRLKLTSPGVLLILAVLAACGIFLLDLFYLSPHIDSQKWAALREEGVRTQHGIDLALQAEQRSLACAAAAWSPACQAAIEAPKEQAGPLDAALRQAMAGPGIDWVWSAGTGGAVKRVWSAKQPEAPEQEALTRAISVLETTGSISTGCRAGLVRLPAGPAVFGGCPASRDGKDESDVDCTYAARLIDPEFLETLGSAGGGRIVFVSGDALPAGVQADSAAPQTLWMTAQDQLAVAWLARDASGKSQGYFLATVPVVHIHRQAVTSRRMVLIILSLSVGLALLVILGSHMLITGPVVRLLGRLQRLESGEGRREELARDLHGEPLMLARRLENAFEKLAHISKTDELTGLANRRHFEQVLDAFYHQARRYNRPMSVIVMDVDFFKAINDAGGHQAGDDVLKQVSAAIEEACRKADLPSRFGGDEFAVLLPETAALDAESVADRIRMAISQTKLHVRGMDLNVTVSLGIADLNAGEMDGPSAMMGLADRALYQAKQDGRNRIVQAHDLHSPAGGGKDGEDGKIALLSKKLAGLDTQFKDLFLAAFEEVMVLLQQRDPHMADHTRKVQHYATLIAEEMELPQRVVKRIDVAAMMHDLGMVAMPDTILLCPSQLDEENMRIMRRHPLLSVRIMERMEFLEQEIPAVRYHHERFDGLGYPEGIAGASIPLTARILAVADAFDAMTSPRTFRDAKSCAEALGELRAGSGTQFDPAVINAFVTLADRIGPELMHIPGLEGFVESAAAAAAAGYHLNGPLWREDAADAQAQAETEAKAEAETETEAPKPAQANPSGGLGG
jgi:diguanylate cyclase (GGDEF)-like protein